MLTIYTTTQCAYCKMVKHLLDKKGVAYETVNIEEQPDRREEAFKISGVQSVPITTNGRDVVIGFQPAKLMELA